jgi:serine/threonine protein phosphatase PrpC
MMTFITAKLSKVGGREVNQDYCDSTCAETGGVWVVADGLGGHRGGEVASETAVTTVLNLWSQISGNSPAILLDLIEAAQVAILEQQQATPQLLSMRTTLVMLTAHGDDVLWGHVGDSRLYHFRDCAVFFQTRDHSVPQTLLDAGEITKEQIRTHPDRNRILRAVGNEDGIKPTILDTPRKARPGDAFLLCTDGFWGYVTETEMTVDLAKSTTPDEWLKLMELRLFDKIETGNDNYTAIAVFVEE